MKKVISILLVLTMAIGLAAIPVFAGPTTSTVIRTYNYDGEIMRNVVVVDVAVTVRGTYSKVGEAPFFNSITGSATGPAASRLTFTPAINGSVATLYVYDLGVCIFKYVYSISNNGTITLTFRGNV